MGFNVVTRLLETGNNLFFFFFLLLAFAFERALTSLVSVSSFPLNPNSLDICIMHCLVLCKLYSLAFLASFFYINHKFIEERFLETDRYLSIWKVLQNVIVVVVVDNVTQL